MSATEFIDEQEIEIGKFFNYGETHVWFAEVKSHKLYDCLLMADFLSVRAMENERTQRLQKITVSYLKKKLRKRHT